jgi:Carboxypeptidase regulatory-like domain/TonB dependent receptor-like, beta-barrel
MKSLILTSILFTAAAFGQSTNGTITGVVTDMSGAVVAGAKISVQNTGTGFTYTATSTGTGNYTVAQLPTGTYDLKVAANGFKVFARPRLAVSPANVLRIDVQMQLGTATDTVTVTTEAPMLKTENSAIVQNVNVEQLESLPILPVNGGGTSAATNGLRDPYALVKTVPGTRYVPSLGMSSNGNNGMNILIDGMTGNMPNPAGIVTMQTQPSAEAVQEVAVLTSNYSAEYGNISGAVMNVTMRSGTNHFHGTAYAYGVNEALNAAQPFSGLKNRQRRYDFGGSFGGPVKIPKLYDGTDKTFFFFSYEQYLENGTINTTSATVPLPSYRNGDFSQLIPLSGNQYVKVGGQNFVDPLGRSILSGTIFDSNSTRTVTCNKTMFPTATCSAGSLVQVRDPFMGNQIPMTSFDPVALRILNLVPQPFGPNANAGLPSSNYQHGWIDQMNTYLPSIKVDHTIGIKSHIAGYFQTVRYHSPLIYPNGAATGLPEPVEPGRGATSASHTARLTYDYTLTPTLLLHFAAGYSDQGILLEPPVTDYNAESALGLKGATVNRLFPNITTNTAPGGVVSPTTGGMTNLGPQGGFLTTQSSEQLPEAQFSATWVKGNHTLKTGWDWRWELEPVASLTNTAGNYTFDANGTQQIALQGLAVSSGTTGFPFASFLLGDVSEVHISAPANYRDQKVQTSGYVQDTWKTTRNLTLDFGLRYDFGTYLRERAGREAAFSANIPNPSAGGHPGGAIYEATCNCSFANNYPWAFAPRVGLAYRLGDKNVVRAGFGIVYAPTNYAQGTVNAAVDSGTPGYGDYVFQLQNGLPSSIQPVWPNFDPAAGALPGTVGAGPAVLGPSAGRPSRQYQWSVGVQRAVTRDLVVEASYIGNRVIWLNAPGLTTLNKLSVPMLNQLGFQVGNLTDATLERTTYANLSGAQKQLLASLGLGIPYAGFPTNQLVRQGLLPFPQYNVLTPVAALGDSWFDALQIVATQRIFHGLTVNANYMYSKSLTLTSSVDPFNPQLGKNLSPLDLPHQFRLSATYTVPTQRSGIFGNKFLSYLVSGWQTGWYLQYQSAPILAQPSSPTKNPISYWLGYGPGPAQLVPGQNLFSTNWTDYNGVVHNTPIDLNCGCFDPRTTVVLNPNAWSAVPDGQFGANQSSIRYFRGIRQPEEDANFGRNFQITEKATLQLRVEWTNIFNRLLLPQPNTTSSYLTVPTQVKGIYTNGYGTINPTAGNGITSMRSGQVIVRVTF